MSKEVQVSCKNSKFTIKDERGNKVTIPDARGYVPNPKHEIFVLTEPSEKGDVVTYSIEDTRLPDDADNRLQAVYTFFPDGHVEAKGPKDFGNRNKEYKCGERAAQEAKRSRVNTYAKMKIVSANYSAR